MVISTSCNCFSSMDSFPVGIRLWLSIIFKKAASSTQNAVSHCYFQPKLVSNQQATVRVFHPFYLFYEAQSHSRCGVWEIQELQMLVCMEHRVVLGISKTCKAKECTNWKSVYSRVCGYVCTAE